MKSAHFLLKFSMVLILAITFWSTQVLAEKPDWAGNDKAKKHDNQGDSGQREHVERGGDEGGMHSFFNDPQRDLVQGYFDTQYRKGHCPPGLRKKGNGCMPPGQAKKWVIGRPLPRDVIFHDLPPRLCEQLGPPPPRHRFVRVAQDILLITTGVGMVIDAIEDLNWEFDH